MPALNSLPWIDSIKQNKNKFFPKNPYYFHFPFIQSVAQTNEKNIFPHHAYNRK